MKPRILILAAVFNVVATLPSGAQTLTWGATDGEPLVDSNGASIADSFIFQLGAFVPGFDPTETNTGEWLTQWRVFDALTYNSVTGFTTADVEILNEVRSGSPHASHSSFSFANLDAYIWIRKGDDPGSGSEWFLARAIDWTFASQGGDCCPSDTIQWSVSDLGPGEVPEWGRQGNVTGPGSFTASGVLGLQTHTFIPEPGSALLLVLGCSGLALRRLRPA